MMPDSDSDDDLPPGWEERATVDGSVYYVNHSTKSTQWTHPRTGKKKKVAGDEISTNVKGIDERLNQLKLTEPRARMNGARTKRYKWLLSHGHSREEAEILSLKPIDSMGLGKLFKVKRFKKPRSGIITKEAWNKKSRRRNVSTGTTKVQKLSTPSRELPFGWEKVVEDTGKILYVDHENHRTTYTDPRLAFAQEEKDTPLGFRQRFDGSSTALQVLHGRDLSGKTAVITGANCGIGNSKYAENNKMSQDEISKLSTSSRHQKIIGDENHKMYEKKQHVSGHFKNTDNATSLRDDKFVSNFNYDQAYATSNSISRPIEEPHKFECSTLFDNKEEKASKFHEDKRTNMNSQTRETLNQQSSHSLQDQIDKLKNRNKRLMDELFDMPKSEETNSSKQQDRGGFQQSLSSRFSQLLDKSQWNPKENKKLFDMPEEPNNSGVTYSPAERDRYSLPQGHSRFSPHQERYFENRGFKGGKDLFDMPQNEQVYSGKTYSLEAQHEPQRHYSRFPNELGMDFDTKKRRVEKEIFDMHKEEIYTSNTNFPLELQNDQRRQDNSLWFPTDNQLFFEKEDSRLRGKTQEIPSADVSTSIQTYPTDKIVRPLSKNAMKVVIVPTCYPSKTITTVIKNQILKDLSKDFPNIFRSELSRGAMLVPCASLHLKKRLCSIIHLHSKPELQLKVMEMEDLESQFTTVQALLLNRNVSSYAFKNKLKKIHPTELNAGAWEIQHSMNTNNGTMFVVKLDNQSLQSIERWFGWIVPYEDTWAEFSKGYETSRALARHGCHVVLACRSVARAEEAIKRIRAERPQALCTAVPLDLRSLRSVKEFVNTLRGDPQFNRGVDILILNAGVFALPHSLTEDGLETTFQVNYLSQFYLVLLLEEMLAKAAPSRVVFVSSESHRFSTMNASNISKEWLSPGPEQFWSMMAYNDSKLCGVVAARELARRWVTRDICVFSCHPGNMVSSDLSRHWCLYRLLFTLVRPFTKSLEQAASTQVYCASATELTDVSGLYFNNCCRCEPSKSAQDPQLASKLWNVSLDLIASHFSSLDIPDKYRHKR